MLFADQIPNCQTAQGIPLAQLANRAYGLGNSASSDQLNGARNEDLLDVVVERLPASLRFRGKLGLNLGLQLDLDHGSFALPRLS